MRRSPELPFPAAGCSGGGGSSRGGPAAAAAGGRTRRGRGRTTDGGPCFSSAPVAARAPRQTSLKALWVAKCRSNLLCTMPGNHSAPGVRLANHLWALQLTRSCGSGLVNYDQQVPLQRSSPTVSNKVEQAFNWRRARLPFRAYEAALHKEIPDPAAWRPKPRTRLCLRSCLAAVGVQGTSARDDGPTAQPIIAGFTSTAALSDGTVAWCHLVQ